MMFAQRFFSLVAATCALSALAACGQPVVEAAPEPSDAVADATPADADPDGAAQDVMSADQSAGDATSTGDSASSVDAAADVTASADAGGLSCATDQDCSSGTPWCDLAHKTCVVCRYAAHCPGPFGRCAAGQCVAPKSCISDKACSADAGVCDQATGHCADCTNHADCATGEVCKLSQCLPAPLDCKSSKDCAVLDQVCTAAGVCADCAKYTDCKPGQACSFGLCLPAVCKPDAGKCTGPIQRDVCKADGSGWTSASCPSQMGCEGGVCKKQVCNPGQKKCDASASSVCAPTGLAWLVTPCQAAEICVGGNCVSKICDAGKHKCTTDGKLETCAKDEKSWLTTACPTGQACDVGACKKQICVAGKPFCDQEKKMLCGALGLVATLTTDCAASKNICVEGSCAPTTCKAGDKLCKGTSVAVCKADGAGWKVAACPDSDGNKCTVETCQPSTHTCTSGALNLCDDGNICTTGACNGFTGACKQSAKVGPCDDGSGCTPNDVCVAGTCGKGAVKIVTWSGQTGAGFADGPVAQARYAQPFDVATAADGALIIADAGNRRIRRISVDGVVSTVAGNGGYGSIDGPGPLATFMTPAGVATGKLGWIYVVDRTANQIRVINGAGTVSTLVGGSGQAGDQDGPVAAALVYGPDSIAVDDANTIWFGESGRHRIRRISADGKVSSPLGGGIKGFVDGVGATARLAFPYDLALGPKGLVWFADGGNQRVRAYDPKKDVVVTKIGTGVAGALDGPALQAQLSTPYALAFGPAGRLWVMDGGSRLLRRLELDGSVTTVMGKKGQYGGVDGALGTATLGDVPAIGFDQGGAAILIERQARRIRRIDPAQKICDDESVCTTDSCDPQTGACVFLPGKTGAACDDGSACTASDACDAKGVCAGKMKACGDANACTNDVCNPYTGTCINEPASHPCDDGDACTPADFCVAGTCKADVGRVRTVAGNGLNASFPGKAALASLNQPNGIARLKKTGILYVTERFGHRISQIAADGAVSAFAGTGVAGFLNGPAPGAKFNQPTGIAVDPFGAVYVADLANHRIRLVSSKGVVSTLAGSGKVGDADGAAATATFSAPLGLDVDSKGGVWVADSATHRIRRISTAGLVTTVAGDGVAGYSDGVGKFVRFHTPSAVLAMADGSVLVADTGNHRVRRVLDSGVVTTWAGNGKAGGGEGQRLSTRLYFPSGLALAPDGSVYISSTKRSDVRVVDPAGDLHRVVGAVAGFRDGMITTARLSGPVGLVASTSASLFIADRNNGRIRQLLLPRIRCQEGTACAPELCDAKTGTCGVSPIGEGGACVPGTCKTAGVCTAKVCTGGAANTCDDQKSCTKDSCDAKTGACVHTNDPTLVGCCSPSVYSEDFEKGAPSWTLLPGAYNVAWRPWTPKDTKFAANGKQVLKFGMPGEATIAKLPTTYVTQYATSSAFAIPTGLETSLSFQFRFDLPAVGAHQLFAYIQVVGGPMVSIGVQQQKSIQGWRQWTYDLSGFGGRTVKLRLKGRIYGPQATGLGISVDAIAVTSTCKAKSCKATSECINSISCSKGACTGGVCAYADACCTTGASCDDNKLCTDDVCNTTLGCQHQPLGSCCTTANDDPLKLCNDGNACTADVCPASGGACLHNEVKGCCLIDSDCDDGKGCTVDACDQTKHACTHKEICCTTDKQCDDGDNICTTDKCVAGKCAYTHLNIPACCKPTLGPYHFNSADQVKGWTVGTCTPSSAAYLPTSCTSTALSTLAQGWQVWTTSPVYVSPKGALYYGDAKKQNFDFGASAQTVRSPVMTVQAGTSTLRFKVNYQTESGAQYDRLVAFLWVDGKRITTATGAPAGGAAWYKGQPGYTAANVWKEVTINVSSYVGKQLQVEFYFNTVDKVSNTTKGVFIDDVRLDSTCK